MTLICLTIPKYVHVYCIYFDFKQTKNVMCTLTGVLRGVSNWPVKIFCAYFGHFYIFFGVLFIYNHVRCLNILNFGQWFHFWGQKKIWTTLTGVLFWSDILAIFNRAFYISRERAPVGVRTILNVWMKSTGCVGYCGGIGQLKKTVLKINISSWKLFHITN